MAKTEVRTGKYGLHQGPVVFLTGICQLLRVWNGQQSIAETSQQDALVGGKLGTSPCNGGFKGRPTLGIEE
jgi:hypothetical protein